MEGMAEEGGKDVVVMWRGFRGVIVEMNTGDGDQSSDLEEVAESQRLGSWMSVVNKKSLLVGFWVTLPNLFKAVMQHQTLTQI
ncbi:hypothetical protein Drorol1_Dr00000411 [Drosera rotundifolia]